MSLLSWKLCISLDKLEELSGEHLCLDCGPSDPAVKSGRNGWIVYVHLCFFDLSACQYTRSLVKGLFCVGIFNPVNFNNMTAGVTQSALATSLQVL